MQTFEGFTSVILVIPVVILFFVLRKRPWGLLFKFVFTVSALAVISGLPVFVYSNGCTFRAFIDLSYFHPFGEAVVGAPFGCTQSFTTDINTSHYLITDSATALWIIWGIVRFKKKRSVHLHEGNQKNPVDSLAVRGKP